MLSLGLSEKRWSPIATIFQWCRDWSEEVDLEACGENEVEHIAKDIGLSTWQLRRLAKLGPEAADLLPRRMAALDLDTNEVARVEPRAYQDLQRVCSMCECHRRCARDFARDSAIPAWRDYCPNAGTLMALNKLPWAARSEW